MPTMQNQPAAGFQPQAPRSHFPTNWQAWPAPKSAPQQAFPVNAALAGNTAPRPTIRAQAPDAPARSTAPLVLPSPEALGLAPRTVAPSTLPLEIDWNNAQARLRRLGAVGFHLDEITPGQWRATLLVPLSTQQTRHVEATAASDAAAVAGALQQAEALAQPR